MFTLALDARCTLGECPVWDGEAQALRFIDIKGKALHRWHPESGDHTVTDLPEDPGSFALAADGGLLLALRSGLWRQDGSGARTLVAPNPEPTETNRFNDGRCDRAGRFFAGTIDEPRAGGTAHLYRYDRRGLSRVEIAAGLTTSNGLAFSPDGRTMYHSDTPRLTVWAYDYDPATGEPTNQRTFATLPGDDGRPDGAAVDAEGCYWVALWEGGRVQRYAPTGELLAEFAVPSRCVTMPAFGGPDLRTLYVTTARFNRPEEELAALPHSGGIFSMRVDVPGLPEPRYDPAA